jgi:hypothetical protein
MLSIGKDCTKEEVQALFGPYNTKNGYCYYFSDDEKFIANIENLWMIVHQQTQLPNTRLINKAEAKNVVTLALGSRPRQRRYKIASQEEARESRQKKV